MPRGVYKRTSDAAGAIEVLAISADTFSALSWWKKLSADEHVAVVNESKMLAQSLLHFGQAKVAIGEHLERLQGILEPHNVFQKFLKQFRFSKRTAYRYIAGYKNAKAALPQTVVKAAMQRGINIIGDSENKPLGIYTEAVKTLPPPQAPTDEQANAYLDALEKMRKETRTTATVMELPVGDPNTLLKESLRFVTTRYKRLPTNKRTRENWANRLIGMLVSEFGLTNHTFTPIAVPEDLQVHRGRPKTQQTATA